MYIVYHLNPASAIKIHHFIYYANNFYSTKNWKLIAKWQRDMKCALFSFSFLTSLMYTTACIEWHCTLYMVVSFMYVFYFNFFRFVKCSASSNPAIGIKRECDITLIILLSSFFFICSRSLSLSLILCLHCFFVCFGLYTVFLFAQRRFVCGADSAPMFEFTDKIFHCLFVCNSFHICKIKWMKESEWSCHLQHK